MILDCSCASDFQDREYGRHRRVHTPGKYAAGQQTFTCTVCGTKRTVPVKSPEGQPKGL